MTTARRVSEVHWRRMHQLMLHRAQTCKRHTCAAIVVVASKQCCTRHGSPCSREAHWTWSGYPSRRTGSLRLGANLACGPRLGRPRALRVQYACQRGSSRSDRSSNRVASQDVFAYSLHERLAVKDSRRPLCSCDRAVFGASYVVCLVEGGDD